MKKVFLKLQKNARRKRALIFRNYFSIDKKTRILDVGSETGSNIKSVLEGLDYTPENVFIADIDPELVKQGETEHKFTPVVLNESGPLPFEDSEFDIVYCSSVIEHVTVSKEEVWNLRSGQIFKSRSKERQKEFAKELTRIGKSYFIQTPYKHFPLECHTWLPFLSWIPRWLLIPTLKFTNSFWIKKTNPDWNLLTKNNMISMFPNADVQFEYCFGMKKSMMAIKPNR